MRADARDPYLGLNNHIKEQAKGQVPRYYTVGTVQSIEPLIIRADGMDLDRNDLKIAQHLKNGWREELSGLNWPLTANLPQARFEGKCNCSQGSGDCYVKRPAEVVSGKTTDAAAATHPKALQTGDAVLLIPSTDGQVYYVVEKFVEVDA